MLLILRLIMLGLCTCAHGALAQVLQNPSAHTHGTAHMTVVYEAGELLIELETPAANMLGFEHAPQNTAQWQKLSQLTKTLNTPENIIDLQPACKVQQVKVKLPYHEQIETQNTLELHGTQHTSHAHLHGNIGPLAANGSNMTVADDEDHHQTHRDIHLSYEWLCKLATPYAIQLHLFSLYPGFEKIDVQWIANGKQGATTLNKSHTAVELKP